MKLNLIDFVSIVSVVVVFVAGLVRIVKFRLFALGHFVKERPEWQWLQCKTWCNKHTHTHIYIYMSHRTSTYAYPESTHFVRLNVASDVLFKVLALARTITLWRRVATR